MAGILAEYLDPMTEEEFFRDYWQNQKLHVHRNDPDFYGDLYSLRQFEDSVDTARMDPDSKITLIPHPESDRNEQVRIDSEGSLSELYERFNEGDSIRIGAVEKYSPSLRNFVRSLSDDLKISRDNNFGVSDTTQIQINLYLTPPGRQAFLPHYDTHDVYILQIHGSKEWFLYEDPVDFPLGEVLFQQRARRRGEGRPADEDELEVADNPVLDPGDLLYVPRGVRHKAQCLDSTSLHLTVAVVHYNWTDLLVRALKLEATENQDLRRPLPLPQFEDGGEKLDLPEAIRDQLGDLFGPDRLEEALESFHRDDAANSDFPTDGYFNKLEQLEDLDVDDVVKRRDGVHVHVEGRTLQFAGDRISVAPNMKSALPFIADNPSFRVGELPTLTTDNSKLMLAKRLIRKGLLTVESSPEE